MATLIFVQHQINNDWWLQVWNNSLSRRLLSPHSQQKAVVGLMDGKFVVLVT